MPLIKIVASRSHLNPRVVTALQAETAALMAQLLRKNSEVTVVQVQGQADGFWSVGGRDIQDRPLAYLEAFITEGTNTFAEKESFIAAAYSMLAKHLGANLSPSYVIVQEIAAENWGYDGLTQAGRKHLASKGQ